MRRTRTHKTRGLTLLELLVAMALFSVVSLVTIQLYLSAYTEFEHSSGTMTLNQRARLAIDKITQIVKTAAPILNANTDAFIHPNSAHDMRREMYELDFISSIGFIPNSDEYGDTWQITDQTSAGYVQDPLDPRFIYENDQALTSFVTRQPSLYRYRIAWNHMYFNDPASPGGILTTKGRSIPPRAVFFERLQFGRGASGTNQGALGWGEGPNSTAAPASYVLTPWLADTGTRINNAVTRPRILARDVHYLTFTRTTGNVLLLRMKMYNRDPQSNRIVEGMTMRRGGFGGNADAADRTRFRYFMVDLTTNIHLPNTI